jgi:hypothetical protein
LVVDRHRIVHGVLDVVIGNTVSPRRAVDLH